MARVDVRIAAGLSTTRTDSEPGESLSWYRRREPMPKVDGHSDPLVFLVLCDLMSGGIAQRVAPTASPWLAPSIDLTVHILGTATSEWLLARIRALHAADGYVSLALNLWDPATGLVARATQLVFFSFPDPVAGIVADQSVTDGGSGGY